MIGCFGKLPSSADFVSLHGAAEEVCEFDAWLQSALAAMRHREDWQALFDSLPMCFFNYRARNGNWLLGGLLSSRDASQRRYPFFIFQLLKGEEGAALANPFTLAELFSTQIKPLLHQAVQGADCANLFERIKALRPLQPQDLDLFRRVHAKFLHDFSFSDIARALHGSWPGFDSATALAGLQASRAVLHGDFEGGIELPLPAERGLKNPTADLWLTWLARMSRHPGVPAVSLLADDFMLPRLYCFPSRHANCAYRLLSGCADARQHLELLSPLAVAPWQHDYDRPLEHVIDQFVDALDATPV
ncbi:MULTISPECIES: type VI secretion system-associated protein TagF [unclassified Pseudomonas]|jgi:type VI secretion system protein ImpM|uniref:type VI secretion system-associated protein TagF n=1 Tax=unclassified Pseudomonas TaxID=196821 RepID=UPI001A9D613E|nr:MULTISPECIES: type VI secretion system-associated protein TagF [unclassified Pseudomonas]MCE5988342.1 type VI secretion system-associated protein TagF [Pseudomonas sp. LM20]MCE5994965.1 type VI secretion system-associated protein TagF [Pseudomonas sp. KCA11]UMY59373.1 type VI secretion system-associated protein TagF [Pseudomonas sp. LS.1a]